MSLTFAFNFICQFSFKKRPTVPWRTLWVQPTLKRSKHDTVWMKGEINVLPVETKLGLAIVVWFLFNSSTETLDLLTCDSRTGSTNSCSFISLLKVASISVCDTSSRLSEIRQFGLSNSPSQKIKTNFRHGEKILPVAHKRRRLYCES